MQIFTYPESPNVSFAAAIPKPIMNYAHPTIANTVYKHVAIVILAIIFTLATTVNSKATLCVMNAIDASGADSFDNNNAGHWTPGIAPSIGNTYNTGPFSMRTAADGNPHIFLGDSLTLSNATSSQFVPISLVLKGTGNSTVTITNLIMLNFSGIGNANGQGIGAICRVGGNISVQGNVTMSDINGAPRWVGIDSVMTGTGTITNAAYVIYSANNSSFTGPMVAALTPTGVRGVIVVTNEAALGGNPASFNAAQMLLNNGIFSPQASFALDHANAGVTIGANGGIFDIASGLFLTNSEPVAGTGTLSLTNAGTLYQSGSFSGFTGTLSVNNGTFLWKNGSALACSVNVASGTTFDVSATGLSLASGSTLSGNGTVIGAVTAGSGSKISPGGSGTAATLVISSNLTLSGGATLVCDFSATNDVLVVNSNVTPSGVTSIQLVNVPAVGTYTLMTAGSLGGSTANFQVQALTTRNRQYALSYDTVSTPNRLLLIVTSAGSAAGLVWQGDAVNGVNNVWDIKTSTNWINGLTNDVYWDGDTVNFTDLGATNQPTLNVTVNPGSVNFFSSSNYNLSGTTGVIAGPTSVSKGGTGTFAMALTNNTYTGGTVVTNGILQLGFILTNGSSPLGLPSGNTSLVTVSNTGTLEIGGSAFDSAYTNAVTINGAGSSPTLGAIDNNAGGLTSGGGDVGIGTLALAGDSTVTVANNWQIGLTGSGIVGNGKTLTKVTVGTPTLNNYLYLRHNAASALANLVINGGGVLFWDSPNAAGSTATIVLTNGGWIDTWSPANFNAGLTFASPIRVADPVNGGMIISIRNGFNNPSPDIFNGPVTLNGTLTFSNVSFVTGNQFNGTNNTYGKDTLNGNISGAGGIIAMGGTANYVTNTPSYIGGNLVILNGINSYTGLTMVTNLVQLWITTANQAGGAYDVVDFGTLDVKTASGNATMPMSSLTLDVQQFNGLAGAGGNLGFTRLSAMPTNPVIYATNLTINANSAGGGGWILPPVAGYAVGQFPLIKYGTINSGGFNNLALGNLPAGVTATLSNNVANNSIDLVVATTGIVWRGTNSPNWDIGLSQNWYDPTIPGATVYQDGNGVVFDDTATNFTAVLTQSIAPGGITVNSTNNYTFTNVFGAAISGSGALVKNGSGTLNMACTNNNFTGGTYINGGTIKLFDSNYAFPHGPSGLNNNLGNVNITGGTLDINALQVPNFQSFGPEGYNVFISGAGVGGNGALFNSSTNNNDNADAGYVTLTGNATVGGPGDINIRHGAAPQLSSQSGAYTLTKVGTGQFRIRYIATVSANFGAVNILGGIVSFESASPAGFGDATKPVNVGSGAGFGWGPITNNSACTRTLICSNNSSILGLNTANNGFLGPVTLDSGNVNLNANFYNGMIFSNTISGAGGITVAAQSIVSIAGTNTYAGNTTVANCNSTNAANVGSVLRLIGNGAITNSPNITLLGITTNQAFAGRLDASGRTDGTLTLIAGQTLRGDNGSTVSGKVIASSGTTITPGGTGNVQYMTLNTNLNLQSGSTVMMEVTADSGLTNDFINVKGTNNYGGTLVLSNIGVASLAAGNSFKLFNNGNFTGNFAAVSGTPGPNLIWSFNPTNGTATVVSTALVPTIPPTITEFSLSGGNVTVNATNGQTGGTYYLLGSTNLTIPLSQWLPLATNVIQTNGAANGFTFTGTNAVQAGKLQQFYILSNTN
jgi:autotransporter-associated beta strand protein